MPDNPQVELTDAERKIARGLGMTLAELAMLPALETADLELDGGTRILDVFTYAR